MPRIFCHSASVRFGGARALAATITAASKQAAEQQQSQPNYLLHASFVRLLVSFDLLVLFVFLSSGGWVKIQLKLCFVLFVLFFVCLFVCLFVCACLFVGSLVYHFAGLFLFCNFVSSGEG